MDSTYAGGMTLPVIQTDRLLLSGLGRQHLEDFTRLQYDPRVAEWLGGLPDPPRSQQEQREDTWRVIATFLGHWALRGYGQWAVTDRETGTFLGRAGLWNPEGWPGVEVGWLIDPEAQNRGYASEAGRASVDFAFDHLGLDEVISVTVPHNAASRRVMEKVGLTDTGQRIDLRGHEQVLYRITRDAWLAGPSPEEPSTDA